MLIYVSSFMLAFLISLICTPLMKKLSLRIGAIDRPNHRKIHNGIMPRLGGLAIFFGFLVTYILFVPLNRLSIAILLGGLVIIITGFIDDKYGLRAKTKLLGQIIASIVVLSVGLQDTLSNSLFGGNPWYIEWFIMLIVFFWIVGVTNAVNLIDGLDGLAAGVSIIALCAILCISLLTGNGFVTFYCLILLGSTLAFLIFNFHPAKIYMGDTGSLFLGFNLATLTMAEFDNTTFIPFVIPALILGVPIIDTLFAIIRRLLNKRKIFSADKNHLHHCLLRLGLTQRKAVLIIYGISILFAISAMIVAVADKIIGMIVVGVLFVLILIGAETLGLTGREAKPFYELMKKMGITKFF